MKTPKLPWEQLKPELLNLRYNEKKSLTSINEWLNFKFGKHVTNARLSQLFKAWVEQPQEEQHSAN